MEIVDFDKVINRTNTNSYKWDKYPAGVLPLWVADMDFEVSRPIKKALADLADFGVIGYARIPDQLEDVFVQRMEEKHNWKIQKDWLVWLPGMIPGLYAASGCISDQHAAVMTSSPVYRPFLDAGSMTNRSLVDIPFIQNNNRWEMDFDSMEANITSEVKMYMLCNPHNPNGRVFSREELQKLTDFCIRHNLILCSDEIHCDLIMDPSHKHISAASLNKEIENQSITLLSPSKTFNIAGLGCTVAIIPNEQIRKNFSAFRYGLAPMPTDFANVAALAAYRDSEYWHIQLLEYLRGNHEYLLKEINKIKGLKMEPLEATYLAWISHEDLEMPDFVALLEKNGVGVQDSSVFGGKGYFRLNFATPRINLVEAIKRIRIAVSQVVKS
jgi:cystathionine beta-lyase